MSSPFTTSIFSRISFAFIVACIAQVPLSSHAGEFNEVLSVGDVAPNFTNIPGVDDKQHSLSDLAEKQIVVVVFTARSCPTALDYEDRINTLAEKYSKPDAPVAVVAISVNRVAADQLPALKKHASETKLHFPFLYDDSQQSAKDYGALFTPQFFVLNKERKIVYMGAMDDSTNPKEVKRSYVDEAIAAILDGKEPEVKETIGVGCRIRFATERRKRAAR